jgi:MFS family permease
VFVAETLLAATAYSLMFAGPTYFIRVFDVPTIVVGRNLGLLLSICGTLGAVSGSIVADRWAARGVKAAKFKVCALGMAMAAPGIAALPFAPTATLGFACVGLSLIFLPFGSVASFAMVQELFPNQLRGQGTAVALLLQAIAGTGGGPIAVGLASDYLFPGGHGFSFAIAAVGLPAILIFLIIFGLGRNSYEATRGRLSGIVAAV